MGDEVSVQGLDRESGRESCEAFGIRIIKGVVSKDHVHMMVSCPPTMAPSEIIRRMKGLTSSKLSEEFPHLRKKYCGQHFWARGYFRAMVGVITEEMIKSYLEHHFLNRAPTMSSGWKGSRRHRLADAYPDFQSAIRTRLL